jgi:hypothetical protein
MSAPVAGRLPRSSATEQTPITFTPTRHFANINHRFCVGSDYSVDGSFGVQLRKTASVRNLSLSLQRPAQPQKLSGFPRCDRRSVRIQGIKGRLCLIGLQVFCPIGLH